MNASPRNAGRRWSFRLNAIETALERLERRLWLAVFGVVSVVLAQAIKEIVQMSSAG